MGISSQPFEVDPLSLLPEASAKAASSAGRDSWSAQPRSKFPEIILSSLWGPGRWRAGRAATRRLKHNKEALQDSCHGQAQITEPETQPLGELTLTEEPGAEGTTRASHASEPVSPCEPLAAAVPELWLCVSSVSLTPRTLNSPIAQSPAQEAGSMVSGAAVVLPTESKSLPKQEAPGFGLNATSSAPKA